MGYVYTGRQTVNNTFRLDGHSPLDSRTVLNRISDVYINHGNKNACALYLNAYAGMLISAFDDDNNVILIALKDHTPYTKDNTTEDVTADNLETYWNVIGQFTEDKINNVIDPSINKIEDYVGSDDNITNRGDAGGITVIPTKDADSVGYSYGLSVNVDNDTIKLVNNALAVGQYKIEKAATATEGFLSSYILKYKAPGSSNWVDVSGGNLIDIPKDFVLKSVHICKASYNAETGKYTESSTPSDAGWAADTNDVYFHFEWMTVDSDSTTTETFLKVADVIAADIVSINTSIGLLENSVSDLERHIDSSYVEINNHINASINAVSRHIDTSIDSLDNKINSLTMDVSANLKFDGGDADPNFKMINKHGNLDKKTISQLEDMTISEILKAILFEVVKPHPVQTEQFTLKWISSTYGGTNFVDVGAPYPAVANNLSYDYKPEKWNWQSSEGAAGTAVSISVDSGVTWKRSSSKTAQVDVMTEEQWRALNASYGSNNGYFFATINLTEGNYAVDSKGDTIDPDTNRPYKAPVAKELTAATSTWLSFTASNRVYWNANKYYASSANKTAWNAKNTEPGTYAGDAVQTKSNFLLPISGTYTFYLQWPSERQNCYLYVPKTHRLNSCNGANPTVEAFDIPFDFTVVDSTIKINNGYVDIDFNKYKITSRGAAGIATLQIVIGLG